MHGVNIQKSTVSLSTINRKGNFLDIYEHIEKHHIPRDTSNIRCAKPLHRILQNIMKT